MKKRIGFSLFLVILTGVVLVVPVSPVSAVVGSDNSSSPLSPVGRTADDGSSCVWSVLGVEGGGGEVAWSSGATTSFGRCYFADASFAAGGTPITTRLSCTSPTGYTASFTYGGWPQNNTGLVNRTDCGGYDPTIVSLERTSFQTFGNGSAFAEYEVEWESAGYEIGQEREFYSPLVVCWLGGSLTDGCRGTSEANAGGVTCASNFVPPCGYRFGYSDATISAAGVSSFDTAWPPYNFGAVVEEAPGVCDELVVNWDPVGQQVVSSQRFTVTKPLEVEWEDLFIRASFSYGFDEFFSTNAARTSLYNAVQLGIYIEPVVVSTSGNTRVFQRTPYQPMDNDYFNVICQPSQSLAGDDVMVFRRSNGDGGEPEPEGIRGLRPCLYINMLFETPTSDTRTVEFFIPSNAPLTMGDPGGIIDLEYGQVLDGGLRRQVGAFDSFSDGAPPFTSGPVETVGTIDVTGSVDGEFGRQFVVCTDVLGEVLFEEPQRPEDGGSTRAVGGPLLINPDAVDGWNVDVTLDPVSVQPIGDPVDGGPGGGGGDPGGGTGGGGGGGNQGSGPGGDACGADWGWEPWSWAGSTLDEMKCALVWAFVPSDMPGWADEQWAKLESQVPFSYGVVLVDFLDVLSDPTTAAAAELCFGAIPMPEYDDGTNTYEPTEDEDACLDIAAQKAAAQENDALLTLLSWCTVGYVMYRFMIGTLGSVFK